MSVVAIREPQARPEAGPSKDRSADPSDLGAATRTDSGAFATRPDVVTMLTIYLVLLLCVPSNLRVEVLGSAGSLANLWALAMGAWWAWARLNSDTPPVPTRGATRSVLLALAGLLVAIGLSYVVAASRPGLPVERSQADIGLVRVLGVASVVWVTATGVRRRAQVERLFRRMVWIGTGLGVLALVQFATGRTWVDQISVPGLAGTNDAAWSSIQRSGLVRAVATASSPLELAVVTAVLVPLSLAIALARSEGAPSRRRWVPVVVLGVAAVLTGSRSALLGIATVFVVLMIFAQPRIRLVVGILGVVGAGLMTAAVPELYRAMRDIFANQAVDPSAQSRLDSWPIALDFIGHRPLLGRGLGTFLPQFRILDNQWLLLAIEVGLVGIVAYVVLLLVAMRSALTPRRLALPGAAEDLHGPALVAGLAASAVCMLFFDAFSFPMANGMIFLTIGLAAVLGRGDVAPGVARA